MNAKNICGFLGIIGIIGMIGFGIWITRSAEPLWAIILLVWFVQDFPWTQGKSSESGE